MENNIKHKVGDRVLALGEGKHPEQPCVYHKEYRVIAVRYCPMCGNQSVNVGFNTENNHKIDCGTCNHTSNCDYKYWTCSKWFAPITPASLEQAVEEEEYELAAIIRDVLKPTSESNTLPK